MADRPGSEPRVVHSLRLGNDPELEIIFYRTSRVMDAKDRELQPVTPSQKVVRHGPLSLVESDSGFSLPVRQSDGIAIKIEPDGYPFKLAVSIDDVNVANPYGRSGDQGYYVSSLQNWIDGIYIGNDRVRQFVALPPGTGHSVSSQLLGYLSTGIIHITAYAPGFITMDDNGALCYVQEDDDHDCRRLYFSVAVSNARRERCMIYGLTEDDPVWYLKSLVQERFAIPGLGFQLFYLCNSLSDNKYLRDYGLGPNAIISLTTRTMDLNARELLKTETEIAEMQRKIGDQKRKLAEMRRALEAARTIREKNAQLKKEYERLQKILLEFRRAIDNLTPETVGLEAAAEAVSDWESQYSLRSRSERTRARDKVYVEGVWEKSSESRLDIEGTLPSRETLEIAPGGRIAQRVELDPDFGAWLGLPLKTWEVKVVDYDYDTVVQMMPTSPPLPGDGKQISPTSYPPLDYNDDTSKIQSVAEHQDQVPSEIPPYGSFVVKPTTLPTIPPPPQPTTSTEKDPQGGLSRGPGDPPQKDKASCCCTCM
ncbi:hypothetical protein QBC47DRAFT_370462 [Echria macrotheca]|uniref:Ubiquitin-like domain-containing protein n=1 Tax=Echria macrotheca TaxID=438768 RepID=A0AAJ0F960_9PEZI|nr:hypothetical protein QBC47DRAFT_370462 [Echria macrotheca]